MSFESILTEEGWKEGAWDSLSMPSCFYDLNLNAIMSEIKNLNHEYRSDKYYYKLPEKKSDILYRQGALKDLEKESLSQGVRSFSDAMEKARKYKNNEEKSTHSLQKACWCMDGAFFYSQAVLQLYTCILESKPEHAAFQGLAKYLEKEIQSEKFRDMSRAAETLMEETSSITYRLDISHNRIVIDKADREDSWDKKVDMLLYNKNENLSQWMDNPFGSVLRLSDIEFQLLEVIEKNNREYFSKFNKFQKAYSKYMNQVLIRFEKEVQFYISFLEYSGRLKKLGFHFSYPQITENQFQVSECFDMVLASKNSKEDLPVVLNDLEYLEGEKFFVVTGPNQGGKTTFARSIGQVAYLAMLGLKSPCSSLKIPVFSDILTHFATEESVETGAGKLKEELNRLAPMMKKDIKKNLVLINELFTTAATYDAHVMGKRVMKHFIKNDCIGIYVTHIHELAKEEEGIISLLAEVDQEDCHIRTYKMSRRAADGIGYAADIVEKYHLSYEELKSRLACGSDKSGRICR